MNYMVFTTRADWRDAPEWANFLAQDMDGGLWWYEYMPIYNEKRGRWDFDYGKSASATACTASLLERPKPWRLVEYNGSSSYILYGPDDEKITLQNEERAQELLTLLNKEDAK